MRRVVILAALISMALPPSADGSEVVLVPPASYSRRSTDIVALFLDGQKVFVEGFDNYQYAHFMFDREVEVGVIAKEPIRSYRIQPVAHGIKATVSGKRLTFKIRANAHLPTYLLIKINDLGYLALLGDRPERDVPRKTDASVRDITRPPYRADHTGKNNVTAIVQRAMDDLSRRGGGTVFFPVGVYQVVGVLKARDAVSLYLAPGARIRSLPDPAHYGNDKFTHPMFDVTAVSNFKIHGRGTLDASGMKIMKRSNTSRRRRIIFGDLKASKRSTRISIKGIVLRDATAWTCSIIYADHCLVEGVKVLNHWDQNDVKIQNDGINLIACRNSVVNGNFVMTGDDAMCAKAQRVGAETSHLTFSNNVLFTMGAGNKVGMNCRGPLHDVVFADNTVIACRRGVVIEAKTKENPTPIRSITFRNITVEGYQGYKGFEQKLLEFKADTAPVRGVRVSNVRSLIRSPDNQSIWGKSGVFDVRVEGLRIGSRLILNRRAGDISIAKGSDSIRFGPGSDKPSRP